MSEALRAQRVDLYRARMDIDPGGYRVTGVTPHATGLRLPSHMAVLDDGRVLASEFAGGAVRDITQEGDYRDPSKSVFADGLEHPGGLLQTSAGKILATDSGSGRIYEISDGGTVSDDDVVFSGVPHPYGLAEFSGRLFTSFTTDAMAAIAVVEPGKEFSDEHMYAYDFPVVIPSEPYRYLFGCGGSWPTAASQAGRLYMAHKALGAIFDVTSGGSYADLRNSQYAWSLNGPLGMTLDPIEDHLYVCETASGMIKRISKEGGYSRFAQVLVAGFQEPSCIRFTKDGRQAFVCDRAVGTVYRLELERL